MVENIMNITSTPGLAVVSVDNATLDIATYGYSDLDNKEKVNSKTLFEIGSTTKAFTALSILLLEQEGKLNRKDSVAKYIPWFQMKFNNEVADITLEQLMMHTSGIPTWTIGTIPGGSDPKLLHQTVYNLIDIPLASLPGRQHEYTTINYDVLALIIENVSGMAYQDYVKEEILDPLGMKDSYFSTHEQTEKEQKAQGYKYEFLHAIKTNPPRYYGNIAAGYLVTNAEDISKWLLEQMGELEVTNHMKVAIKESHSYPEMQESEYYWAGWVIRPNKSTISHSGNNPDFSSNTYISLDDKKAVFVLSNMSGTVANQIGEGMFSLLNGRSLTKGLILGSYERIDVISLILCLISLAVIIRNIINKDKISSRFLIAKSIIGILLIFLIVSFPWMVNCYYSMLWVWVSRSVFLAQLMGAVMIGEYIAFGYMNKIKE